MIEYANIKRKQITNENVQIIYSIKMPNTYLYFNGLYLQKDIDISTHDTLSFLANGLLHLSSALIKYHIRNILTYISN